jgi:hypothetical protein
MPRRRSSPAATRMVNQYLALSHPDREEFWQQLVDLDALETTPVTLEHLIGIVARCDKEVSERFLAWIWGQAMPAIAQELEEALAAPAPGRPGRMAERDALIIRLKENGKKPLEIYRAIGRLGVGLTNADGNPTTLDNIRTVIKRARRKERNGN